LKEKLDIIEKGIGEIKTDVGVNKANIEAIKTDAGINKTNILVGFEDAKEERVKIKVRIDETYNAVDGFIKIVTKLEDEFTIMKEDLKRVKEVIKEKLGVDLLE